MLKSPSIVNGGKASDRLFFKNLKIQSSVGKSRLKRQDLFETRIQLRSTCSLVPKVRNKEYYRKNPKKRKIRLQHRFQAFREGPFLSYIVMINKQRICLID